MGLFWRSKEKKFKEAAARVNEKFGGLLDPATMFARTAWGMSSAAVIQLCQPLTLLESGKITSPDRPHATETTFLLARSPSTEGHVIFRLFKDKLFEIEYRFSQHGDGKNIFSANNVLGFFALESEKLRATYGDPTSVFNGDIDIILSHGMINSERWELPETNIEIFRSHNQNIGSFIQKYSVTTKHDYLFAEAV